MSTMQRRRQLVKACKKHGLRVQPAALQAMLQYDPEDQQFLAVSSILEALKNKMGHSSNKIITVQLWEEGVQEATPAAVAISEALVNDLERKKAKKHTSSSSSGLSKKARIPTSSWHIVDAFDTPKLVFDSLRKQFRFKQDGNSRPSLMGSVDDKIEMMTQRFLRVQQRVSRSLNYLTSIDRLLGTSATSTQVLFGLLHATSTSDVLAEADGVAPTGFELEDLTGTVPLQLHSNSQLEPGAIYGNGCMVLVEGVYDNGVLLVNRMQMPPVESKKKSMPFIPPPPTKLHQTSKLGNSASLAIYSMSNVALDDPNVVKELEDLVFDLSEREGSMTETVLVLMGNFTTPSMTLSASLDELSHILEPLPSLHSVVIIPGPQDTPSMCWPLAPIKAPSSFSNPLKARVHFASNPCRLYYGDQEVVFFRQDLIAQHVQREVLSMGSNGAREPIANRVLRTTVAQGHLLPQAPVYWNFDHALNLYPLPEIVVVGLEERDDKVRSIRETGCQILTPGSQGNWAKVTLQKAHRRRGAKSSFAVELSQDPIEEEEKTPAELMKEIDALDD